MVGVKPDQRLFAAESETHGCCRVAVGRGDVEAIAIPATRHNDDISERSALYLRRSRDTEQGSQGEPVEVESLERARLAAKMVEAAEKAAVEVAVTAENAAAERVAVECLYHDNAGILYQTHPSYSRILDKS